MNFCFFGFVVNYFDFPCLLTLHSKSYILICFSFVFQCKSYLNVNCGLCEEELLQMVMSCKIKILTLQCLLICFYSCDKQQKQCCVRDNSEAIFPTSWKNTCHTTLVPPSTQCHTADCTVPLLLSP